MISPTCPKAKAGELAAKGCTAPRAHRRLHAAPHASPATPRAIQRPTHHIPTSQDRQHIRDLELRTFFELLHAIPADTENAEHKRDHDLTMRTDSPNLSVPDTKAADRI